jgi:hypothetical protein
MKIILLFLLLLASLFGFGQAPVKDKSKINQLKSIEYMQWKFSPRWYYILFHNYYRKHNKNNINQYAPTMGIVAYTNQQAEKQKVYTDTVYNHSLTEFVDRSIDVQYTLKKNTFNQLFDSVNVNIQRYLDGGGSADNVYTMTFESERIKSNIQIINDSHMSNSIKREAYINQEAELRKLVGISKTLCRINKTAKNYE